MSAAGSAYCQAPCRSRSSTPKRVHACRYVDAEGLVSAKGQVAAHIQSADELVLTELIFAGAFQVNVSSWQPDIKRQILESR